MSTSNHLTEIQHGLTAAERIYQIAEHGMCIGCGICQSMESAINVELSENGFERPLIAGSLDQQGADRIMAVCPGTRVEGLPEDLINKQSNIDPVWGVWQEIYLSYSAQPEIRHLSSTGGLLTGLALYLIESGEVDFILHAQASQEHPSFGEPCISRNKQDVLSAAGSRYGPTATLRYLTETLDQAEQSKQRFAFIGTPCDVSALRNYAQLDPRVNQLCTSMLTMVCGGFMAPKSMRTFVEERGIDFNEIDSLRYRGNGCPGPTRITTKDGAVHEFSYLDFWGDDESSWGLPPRCKVCPDGIGDSADIAAADTWDGGSPTVEDSLTDPGSNAAVVRTERGLALMQGAIEAGYLVRDKTLTPADMNRFQPHQEAKKRAVWARFEGIRQAGNMVPDTKNLRLQALFAENPEEDNAAETEGARLRVENGKFSEPTPKRP